MIHNAYEAEFSCFHCTLLTLLHFCELQQFCFVESVIKVAVRPLDRTRVMEDFLELCGVQSSGILVALWPTCVVLPRYVNSLVTAEPAWSSLAQDLYGSGRHESGIRTVTLPGTLACVAPR